MSAKAVAARTDEQQLAISRRGVSIALSAGAGCGKTYVLTERFLDHFDPHDPDALRPDQLGQLIAITFTDRAAREMRDRIRGKCYERLLQAKDDKRSANYWFSLVRFLDSARVSTIHAFCASLLRSHAIEVGLDPQFGVLEQSEANTLLAEVIDDTLRQVLAEGDAAILDLLVLFSLDGLREMIMSLVRRRERDHYDTWLALKPEQLVECWTAFHRREVVPAVLRRITSSRPAQALAELTTGEVSTNQTMRERAATIQDILRTWSNGGSPTTDVAMEAAQLREAAKVQGGGGKKEWVSEEVKDAFQTAATQLRDLIDKTKNALGFDAAASTIVAGASLQVLHVANRVCKQYSARKKQLGRQDFDDLLTAAHRLLTNPDHSELRERLSNQTRLLLVDEFQDTDPLQVELVEALCGEDLVNGKLFFVGDHKQSIYRFRGADTRVFLGLRERMPNTGRLPLSRNFRSQPAILEFVNALFREELPNYERLFPSRLQQTRKPAIEFLWAPTTSADETKESASQMREREADWIAKRLRSLLDSGEPLIGTSSAVGAKPELRAARHGDIAILFRALSNVQLYEQALQKYEIPYYLVGGHAFYAQQEIFDLVNLLRSVASPADGLSLAGVLRSPFFSLADETLYWLAQHADGLPGGLLSAGAKAPLDVAERQKVQFASKTLSYLRGIKDRVPVAELINQALDLTGYDAALLAEFLGERKLANLRKLVEQARSFDRAGLFTLDDFIAQLADFVAEQPDEPLAATHPEATNVVRLMSIHQAKGLEFPIVVVPDLERPWQSERGLVDFTISLGPMVKYPARGADSVSPIGGLELYRAVCREEEEQEAKRLLYVATTRAADYLILSSGVKEVGKPTSAWTEMLARHFDLATGRLLDALPADWAEPDVRVFAEDPMPSAKPASDGNRRELSKLLAEVRELAANGQGELPPHVGPVAVDVAARRQFSFSRLTGNLKADVPEEAATAESEYVLPATILDPLGLGTLVHAVVADLDFSGPVQQVQKLVDRHAERHIKDPPEELNDAMEMLERLMQSPMASTLATAKRTYRELEFMLSWPVDADKTDGTYVRGFIDRLWQDASGNWHVLDFKTNRVTSGNLLSTAAKYEMQMFVYALAVEQIFGQSPKSLTLYFLRTGGEHTFEWNPAARKRVVAWVSDSIASARTTIAHA